MHGAFRACSHAPSHATRHPGVNFNFPIPTHPAPSRCASLFDASTSFDTPHAPPPASTLTIHPLTLPCMVSTTLRSWVDNLQPTAPLAPHRSHGACATSRHPAPCCCESLFAASCASSLHTYTPATSTHSHLHLSTHPTLRSVGLTTVHLQPRQLATAHTVRTLAYHNSAFQTHAPLVLCVVCRGGYSPQGEN